MGRHSMSVRACEKSLEALALWLCAQRERAGLTYAQMAQKVDRDAASLSRADKGQRVPSRGTLVAYVEACGADLAEATRLWKEARAAAAVPRGEKQRMLRPEVVGNFAGIHEAMLEFRRTGGQPSLRALHARARKAGSVLPPTTVSRVLRGLACPPKQLFLTFMKACGVYGAHVHLWAEAWDRANKQRTRTIRRAAAILMEEGETEQHNFYSLRNHISRPEWELDLEKIIYFNLPEDFRVAVQPNWGGRLRGRSMKRDSHLSQNERVLLDILEYHRRAESDNTSDSFSRRVSGD
ncbi:helix-turn-helix domain-containing protein [Streptomyces sp. CJ_13]|uniref:helix-turn-helix domain-containing protein n=1 Tax=Streptomyces sp. CJ_13 TaxID=2724943 RepID=UPI001BDD6BE7|nr:helix-turn-helix transcriptional regulator [Streptomyces sp. CJ_13]MBT1187833.1 helix-turn-helix domain-containing protein [Streptomyces sp. CJ_13]